MTDSTDGAWKSPAKASALWRNKEPGTHSEKYGWKRGGGDKERVRSRERDGGRRRCCLFNVPTCREDPCEGEVGVGGGLRSHVWRSGTLSPLRFSDILIFGPRNPNETNERDSALRRVRWGPDEPLGAAEVPLCRFPLNGAGNSSSGPN